MKREEIEKAAIELCTSEKQEEWLKDYGIHCFLDGARWRINSVWHTISEEPGCGKHILVHFRSGNFNSWFASADILSAFKMFEVEEWAYVEDLLPTKDE